MRLTLIQPIEPDPVVIEEFILGFSALSVRVEIVRHETDAYRAIAFMGLAPNRGLNRYTDRQHAREWRLLPGVKVTPGADLQAVKTAAQEAAKKFAAAYRGSRIS